MDEVPPRVSAVSRPIPPRSRPAPRRVAVAFVRATLLVSASLSFGCGGDDAASDAGIDDAALSDADERDAPDDFPDADPSDAGPLDGDVPPDGSAGVCGDGVVDPGESCDDGDAMGDTPGACREGCRFPFCGDGILDPGERCDDGAANGDGAGACRPWCEPARCGDGVVDPGEACDEGFANGDLRAGACRTSCTRAVCGDAVVDPSEGCDDGVANSGTRPGACRPDCSPARCGDGVLDLDEECDLGAANADVAGALCRTTCRVPRCGDGVVDRGELCDQGVDNGFRSGACRPDCNPPSCGDGIADPGEACDDGNFALLDGCGTSCQTLTYPSATPAACHDGQTTNVPGTSPTQTVCQVMRASTSLASYRAHPGIQALEGRRSASSDECVAHYFRVCYLSPCPTISLETRLTVEACDDLVSRTSSYALCQESALEICGPILERGCPQATPERCENVFFRRQLDLSGNPGPCAATVEAACEALAEASCPSPTLERCDAWQRDATSYGGTACRWFAAAECPRVLATCLSPSLARCPTADAIAATLHPVCGRRLVAGCVGWEERFCPPLAGLVDSTTCMRDYPTIEARLPAECRPWLESTCTRVVRTALEAESPPSETCFTQMTREGTGYDYEVVDALARADTFDCTPSERLLVHPNELFFTATSGERLAGDLELAAERRRLGATGFASCEEYVDERFWSHGAWRAYAKSMRHDPRRVMQLAYATSPEYADVAIGTRGLLSELRFGAYPSHSPAISEPGRSYSLHPRRGAPVPRNDFDRLLDPENAGALAAFLDVGTRANPLERESRNRRNGSIHTRMSRLRDYWPIQNGFGPQDGWHWHPTVSASLQAQGISDTELAHLHFRRARFEELLTMRRLRAQAYDQARANPLLPIGSVEVLTRLGAQLRAIDDEIESLLVDADDRLCFLPVRDAAGRPIPSACDWSPHDFVEAVETTFDEARERARTRCRQLATRDFSSLRTGYPYLVAGVPEPVWREETGDPTRSVDAFETYLTRRASTIRLLRDGFGGDDPVRRPLFEDRYSAGDTYGSTSRIAARWSATAGYVIDVPAETSGLCGVDARADGELSLSVFIDDRELDILRGGFRASAREPSPGARRFDTYLEVLGVDVWNEDVPTTSGTAATGFVAGDYDFNLVYTETPASFEERDSLRVPVFTVAGFDIVAEVGYAGQVGLSVNGEARVAVNDDAGCGPGLDLTLGANVRPFANLDGFLQVGIDLYVVEVGVGGSLRLIGVAVPLSTNVSARTRGPLESLGRARLEVGLDGRVELDSMSGHAYFYVDPIGVKPYRKTFVSWGGREWTIPLFEKRYVYEMEPLLEYCRLTSSCR